MLMLTSRPIRFLLLFSFFSFAAVAIASCPAPDIGNSLRVTIAISKRAYGNGRVEYPFVKHSSNNNRTDVFHVTITNQSDHAQYILRESCAAGRNNLRFELTDEGGNKTIATRTDGFSGSKEPVVTRWILAPQEIHVFDVFLSDPDEWKGFPAYPSGTRKLTMRAIYEVKEDEEDKKSDIWQASHVWTGKIVPEPIEILLFD